MMKKMTQMLIIAMVMIMLFGGVSAWANSAPVVSNVTANQRTDGSGIVDVYYTLGDADGDDCTVSIEVSDDGGNSWNVAATDLSGNIGAGISLGRRHIIWNSKTDILGGFGTNYKVMVGAIVGDCTYFGTYSVNGNNAYSNPLIINNLPTSCTVQISYVSGYFTNWPLNEPKPGWGAYAGDCISITGSSGGIGHPFIDCKGPAGGYYYELNELFSCLYSLLPLEFTLSQGDWIGVWVWNSGPGGENVDTLTNRDGAMTFRIDTSSSSQCESNIFTIDNRDTGDDPIITSISSQYCSQSKQAYFLDGVSLNQQFTATIDWNELTTSQVKWYLNSTVIATDSVSGNSVSRTFNVGTEFNVGDRLYVQAIADEGQESVKVRADFEIVSPPPGLMAGILSFQNGKYKSFPFNIGFPELKKDAPPLTDKNKIAEIAQVDWKSIIEVTAETDLNGHTKITAGSDYISLSKDDFKISNISVGGNLKVVLTYDYSSGQWTPGGGFDLAVSGKYKALPTYVVFMVGFIPVPTYYRFAVDASVSANCRFTDGSADNPVFFGEVPVNGGVEGMAGAGIADCLACEGFLRGGLNFEFQLPEEPYLKDWYLSLTGGIRIVLLLYKHENPFLFYRWPEEEGAMAFGVKAMAVENFEPMSRDYLTGDYAQWHGGINMMKLMDIQPLDAGGTETTLQTNIFGQSNAIITVSGSTKCLVWLYDEPSRNSLDRTMLVYSIDDGGGWSDPCAIDDNGTADAVPALAVDASGNFVCVWANAAQLIPDGTDLAGFADKLDIQMAIYDIGTDTWTSETVTSASALDYNPKVACDDSNNITVAWTHDDNNDMLAENPPVSNTVLARTKTGSGWETIQTLATVSGLVKYTDTEADSANSYIVYCLDSDSDLETDEDNELYYMDNTGGSWSTPIQLTSDPIADVNPQLVKTSTDMMLLWAKGGKIVSTTDITGMTGITDVVAQEGSSGQRSFVAAVSPTDNISVIWNDPSETGSDIYTATYDPTMAAWSDVVQITDNRDMERSISAAYSAGDTLEMAYNKVHIVEGDGLDVFGQVDLCTYEYQIGSDLTVTSDSITISDPNAIPSDTVTLQAIIANIGDTAIDNIPVAFYCGETADPANQIDQTQIISSALAAGDETVVSVSWTIPESDDPLNIIVVIDPELQIEDKDRQNNSASVAMFGANIAIENIVINDSGFGSNFYISADIVNTGFIPVSGDIECNLTAADDPNTILDSQSVAPLEPGQSHTITLTLLSEQVGYGYNQFQLTLDPCDVVAETAENDNVRNVLLNNTVPYDLVVDGIIDTFDLNELAGQWLDTTGGLTADIAPYGGDGTVDLADFAEFATAWLEDYNQ